MYVLKSGWTPTITAGLVGLVSFGITLSVVLASPQGPSSTPAPASTQPVASTPQTVEELDIGAVKQVGGAAEIEFPIDDYRPSAEEQNVILRAEYHAMQNCMAKFGLAFDFPAWSVPLENHDYDRLFGVLDLDETHVFGYHLPGEQRMDSGQGTEKKPGSPSGVDQDTRFLDVASGDGAREIDGRAVPRGGCIAEARGAVNDDGARQALYEEAINYGLDQSNRDTRVLDAFGAWSGCMKEQGFDYATPSDAINDPKWATPSASKAEIQVASADVSCKNSTNLTGLRVAVASAWQALFIETHQNELDHAVASSGEQLSAAEALLAAG